MTDRQAWLEARRKGLGGTDAAAILGLSRYRTPVDVWEDKLGIAPERPATPAMEWGLRLEDAIAQAYAVETGRAVRRAGGLRKAYHVSTFPMFGSIDRMSFARPVTVPGGSVSGNDPRVLELKTARSADLLGDPDGPPEQRIPADWYVQVQHYAEVVDVDAADVAVLIGGSDFRIIPIPRDRAFGSDLVAELGDWWRRYVVPKVQPPVTGDDLDFLARKYPRDSGEEVVATADLALVIDKLLGVDAAIDALEAERKDLRARIEDAMGTAGRLVSGTATVSWRSHERKTTNWREIAGGLRSAIETMVSREREELRGGGRIYGVEEVLSEGFGTTNLDEVEALFTSVATARPFIVKRKDA